MSFPYKPFLTDIIYLSQHFLTVYPYPISSSFDSAEHMMALHVGKRCCMANRADMAYHFTFLVPHTATYVTVLLSNIAHL